MPATELDYARFRGIPHGYPANVHLRFPRSSELQRWWRGLMGKAAEGLGVDPQALHDDIKIKASLIERVHLAPLHGLIAVKLRSTAYPEMGEEEFSHFCDVGVELLHRDYLGEVRERQFQKQIIEWAGRRPKLRARAPAIIAA